MQLRCWAPLSCLLFALPAGAQTLTRQNVAAILGFENNTRAGVFPSGWGGNDFAGIVTDDQIVHTGRYSARIERTPASPGSFSTISQAIPVDFTGATIQWRGYIRGENEDGLVALWIREDSPAGGSLSFGTLQPQNIKGTADWTQYSVSIPVQSEASQLVFGFFLIGNGKAWVDDLELLVDGRPIAQAPQRILSVLDTDHQFDGGSGIALGALSDLQTANLSTLARVWGFLKYHHPAVTSGKYHWDYELFRILPQVAAAPDAATTQAALLAWIANLGSVADCSSCAALPAGLALTPDLDWISDENLLGSDLSRSLLAIYRNRPAAPAQFYVSTPFSSNPSFDHELSYGGLKVPDSGYQLLALFRYWNMVQYFYPNRTIMSDDPANSAYWTQTLTDFIPRVAQAANALAYQQELIRFIAKINDTHANLWSSLGARPPLGSCYVPVDLQFVEGRPIVLRNTGPAVSAGADQILAGDVIQQIDGVNVSDLLVQWTPLYADSNQAARLRDMAAYMTRGQCGAASLQVDRGGQATNLKIARLAVSVVDFSRTYVHDRPGDTFQMLSPDVAYVKLSSVRVADSASYVRSAAGTKGMIVDLRNYPSEFVVFALGQLFVSRTTDFARFTFPDLSNPGAFRWGPPVTLVPQQPNYPGKIAILVDEVTQSQAEYTTMAFRSAPGAIVIGSTTAGADGNVSTILLPGGLSSYISGLGVFYPDSRPTQRVGIVPDIVVTPTIAGVRAGRDELLEEAIRQIQAN